MKMSDIFDRVPFASKFTRKGASIVPPTPQEVATALRDKGMAQSAAHADRETPNWQARAVGYVRLHATVHASFLCEDVRAMAEADGFDLPPSKTAWGSVMRQAAREGIVYADGYAPANSSRRGPKSLWRSLVRAA